MLPGLPASHWDAGWLPTRLPWLTPGGGDSFASPTAPGPKVERWLPQVSATDRASVCVRVFILQPLRQPFKPVPGKTLPIRELSNSEAELQLTLLPCFNGERRLEKGFRLEMAIQSNEHKAKYFLLRQTSICSLVGHPTSSRSASVKNGTVTKTTSVR